MTQLNVNWNDAYSGGRDRLVGKRLSDVTKLIFDEVAILRVSGVGAGPVTSDFNVNLAGTRASSELTYDLNQRLVAALLKIDRTIYTVPSSAFASAASPTAAQVDTWRGANTTDPSPADVFLYTSPTNVLYTYSADDTGLVTLVSKFDPSTGGDYDTVIVNAPQTLISSTEPGTVTEYIVTATVPVVAITGSPDTGVEMTVPNPVNVADKINVSRQSAEHIWLNGNINGYSDGIYMAEDNRTAYLRAKSDLSGWYFSE